MGIRERKKKTNTTQEGDTELTESDLRKQLPPLQAGGEVEVIWSQTPDEPGTRNFSSPF